MARPNSETVTTFGEVLHSANNAYPQGIVICIRKEYFNENK